MSALSRLMLAGAVLVVAAPSAQAQDARRGKALFAQCAKCHGFNPARNDLGPNLKGVVGRKAASVKGYAYSGAMKRSAIVWDSASLNAYLAEPRIVVPRTTMPAAGVPDSQDRQDLIAYLKIAP